MQFAIPTAKAEVPDAVTAYNFRLNIGEEESQAEEGVEKKADDDNPGVQTVTIEADPEVDNVLVEYLNEDGKTIAISQFAVELAAGEETVADDFDCLEASALVVKGSADIIHVGDDLALTASVIYGDEFSEDAIEREVSNDDMTYELVVPEDEEPEFTHCFEPKQGENGTFTATEAGYDCIEASYTEELTGLFYPTVLDEGEEIEGYCLWVTYFGDAGDWFKMIHSDNPLPERFNTGDILPFEMFETGIVGVNDTTIRLAGMVNGEPVIAMQAEWSGEGDYFQVSNAGQEGHIHLTGAGTDGTITATLGEGDDKQEFSATLTGIEAEAAIILPVIKEEYDDDGFAYFEYREMMETTLEGGDTLQLYPGGAYLYKDEENEGQIRPYGFFGTETDDTITWSMEEDSAETITIDANGLVSVENNAPEEDFGAAWFTVSDYQPDESYGCEITVFSPRV